MIVVKRVSENDYDELAITFYINFLKNKNSFVFVNTYK